MPSLHSVFYSLAILAAVVFVLGCVVYYTCYHSRALRVLAYGLVGAHVVTFIAAVIQFKLGGLPPGHSLIPMGGIAALCILSMLVTGDMLGHANDEISPHRG